MVIQRVLPKGILGLMITLILIFLGSRFKGIKIDKFDGDWGPIIFTIGAMALIFFILWLLDTIRNFKKKASKNEND